MNTIAKMYPKLSAVELSAILMKGAALSAASMERDSGFNSGSSEHEDDLKSLDQSSRDGLITPENSSEDSVEVKLPQAVIRNKRKSTEPLRVISDSELLGPIKKRIRPEEPVKEEKEPHLDHHANGDPFRPWAPSEELPPHFPNPADLLVRHPGVTTLHRAISLKPLEQLQQPSSSVSPPSASTCQQQPLALISKRKNTDPLRVISDSDLLGPIKKRIRYEDHVKEENDLHLEHQVNGNPFRPWAPSEELSAAYPLPAHFPNPADLLVRHPGVTTLHRAINLKPLEHLQQQSSDPSSSASSSSSSTQQQPLALTAKSSQSFKTPSHAIQDTGRYQSDGSVFIPPHPVEAARSTSSKSMQPRNYKNMTRERRIEANARERTRVHTISAAYENLRQAVPDYSPSQKLSKLSILRIACSYILNLSRIVGDDYSADGSEPSVDECVEMVTKTILTEGKVKKKKDE